MEKNRNEYQKYRSFTNIKDAHSKLSQERSAALFTFQQVSSGVSTYLDWDSGSSQLIKIKDFKNGKLKNLKKLSKTTKILH